MSAVFLEVVPMGSLVSPSARRFWIVAIVAVALASAVALIEQADAQTGPTASCSADETSFGVTAFGLGFGSNRLTTTGTPTSTFPLASPLAAGTYDINAVSYDGYPDRILTVPQLREQWTASFLAADGSVLATTAPTGDIADGVNEDTWSGSVGSVTLASQAVSVQVNHAGIGDVSVNSVYAVCIGADLVEPEVELSSGITVDFVDLADRSSTIGVSCGDLSESATGSTADLAIGSLDPGTECLVEYPLDFNCDVIVETEDVDVTSALTDNGIVVNTPPGGGVVAVSITCDADDEAIATTTTLAPTTTTVAPTTTEGATGTTTAPTTTTASVTTTEVPVDVQGRVELPASPAQPQTGTPTFTG